MINRKLAVKILENMGYRVDVAVNGLEAVNAVASTPYDLVLMDVQMPEMDGLTAVRKIREFEGHKNCGNSPNPNEDVARPTTIIAMTAGAMKGDREKCLEAGMNDYISKPIKITELTETIGRWLHPGSGRDH